MRGRGLPYRVPAWEAPSVLAAFAIGTIGRRGPEQLLDGTTGKITNTFAPPVLAAPTRKAPGSNTDPHNAFPPLYGNRHAEQRPLSRMQASAWTARCRPGGHRQIGHRRHPAEGSWCSCP